MKEEMQHDVKPKPRLSYFMRVSPPLFVIACDRRERGSLTESEIVLAYLPGKLKQNLSLLEVRK
jgi:hypothetical protein